VVYDGSPFKTSVKNILACMILPLNIVSKSSRPLHTQPTKRNFSRPGHGSCKALCNFSSAVKCTVLARTDYLNAADRRF
jgi:hypothetical protein